MNRRSARLLEQASRLFGRLGTRALAGSLLLNASVVLAQAAGEESGGLEGVVVTARNRVESAQEVPLPIAVLNGDRLEREDHRRSTLCAARVSQPPALISGDHFL